MKTPINCQLPAPFSEYVSSTVTVPEPIPLQNAPLHLDVAPHVTLSR